MKAAFCFLFFFLCASATCCALTTEEIAYLKKNGVSDATIQLMVRADLEKEGRKESSIRITESESATVWSTGRPSATPVSEQQRRDIDNAWEMLKNFSLELER